MSVPRDALFVAVFVLSWSASTLALSQVPASPPSTPASVPQSPPSPRLVGSASAAEGPLSVRLSIDPPAPSVAERVTVRLDAVTPEGWSVTFPAIGATLGRARVLGFSDERTPDGEGVARVYVLEPYLPGDDVLPELSVSATSPTGDVVSVTVPSVTLAVRSVLPEGSVADPAALAELELADAAVPAGRGSVSPVVWGVPLGVAAVMIALAMARRARARRRAELIPAPSPASEALARIGKWVDAPAAAPPEHRAALDDFISCTRAFAASVGVSDADERSAGELVDAFRQRGRIDDASNLGPTLLRVEGLRFSGAAPEPGEISRLARSLLMGLDPEGRHLAAAGAPVAGAPSA